MSFLWRNPWKEDSAVTPSQDRDLFGELDTIPQPQNKSDAATVQKRGLRGGIGGALNYASATISAPAVLIAEGAVEEIDDALNHASASIIAPPPVADIPNPVNVIAGVDDLLDQASEAVVVSLPSAPVVSKLTDVGGALNHRSTTFLSLPIPSIPNPIGFVERINDTLIHSSEIPVGSLSMEVVGEIGGTLKQASFPAHVSLPTASSVLDIVDVGGGIGDVPINANTLTVTSLPVVGVLEGIGGAGALLGGVLNHAEAANGAILGGVGGMLHHAEATNGAILGEIGGVLNHAEAAALEVLPHYTAPPPLKPPTLWEKIKRALGFGKPEPPPPRGIIGTIGAIPAALNPLVIGGEVTHAVEGEAIVVGEHIIMSAFRIAWSYEPFSLRLPLIVIGTSGVVLGLVLIL